MKFGKSEIVVGGFLLALDAEEQDEDPARIFILAGSFMFNPV